jgi:ribonucleotide reductase class II
MTERKNEFIADSPSAPIVFYRTYSRKNKNYRETWEDTIKRDAQGLYNLGDLTEEEYNLLLQQQQHQTSLPSGRWLWVGGTNWIERSGNNLGAYNCSSMNVERLEVFGHLMKMAMMGCGTGAVLEEKYVSQLPKVSNQISLQITRSPGEAPKEERVDETEVTYEGSKVKIIVGDSKEGWTQGYQEIINLAADKPSNTKYFEVDLDLGLVRDKGERLQGFGGVANPNALKNMFESVVLILNKANDRKLTPEECCLLIDEAAKAVVAGNLRRSAGMRQFDGNHPVLKENLWTCDEEGNWFIDPKRDALRMANHTRNFHHKPSYEDIKDAVSKQHACGEGAIMWCGEAVARSNADLITTESERTTFLSKYNQNREKAKEMLRNAYVAKFKEEIPISELEHRINRHGTNPCGEVCGSDFMCNLSEIHLNMINPGDEKTQEEAFRAGALSVASLLNHEFQHSVQQDSRKFDPIVGVGMTGVFDYFVNALGREWIEWWMQGRSRSHSSAQKFLQYERKELEKWKEIVRYYIYEYCERKGLKVPNRYTLIKPSGTQSLLTGASSGWHPPKGSYVIRRIQTRRNDPVALAALDCGYPIVPSADEKDENGYLLNDPFDERVDNWLIEVPMKTSWADTIPNADKIDPEKFPVEAQFDFAMQVQKYYVTHNASSTLELKSDEIPTLAKCIYDAIQNDEGYISFAILARMEDGETFPRLPFEPISKEKYEKRVQLINPENFYESLQKYDTSDFEEAGPSGCDKCVS